MACSASAASAPAPAERPQYEGGGQRAAEQSGHGFSAHRLDDLAPPQSATPHVLQHVVEFGQHDEQQQAAPCACNCTAFGQHQQVGQVRDSANTTVMRPQCRCRPRAGSPGPAPSTMRMGTKQEAPHRDETPEHVVPGPTDPPVPQRHGQIQPEQHARSARRARGNSDRHSPSARGRTGRRRSRWRRRAGWRSPRRRSPPSTTRTAQCAGQSACLPALLPRRISHTMRARPSRPGGCRRRSTAPAPAPTDWGSIASLGDSPAGPGGPVDDGEGGQMTASHSSQCGAIRGRPGPGRAADPLCVETGRRGRSGPAGLS